MTSAKRQSQRKKTQTALLKYDNHVQVLKRATKSAEHCRRKFGDRRFRVLLKFRNEFKQFWKSLNHGKARGASPVPFAERD